jgi:hypothetical protein
MILLEQVIKKQDSFNKKVNPNWVDAGYDFQRAITDELSELMNQVGWKWWKNTEQTLGYLGYEEWSKIPGNLEQARLEVVDIFHFLISDQIVINNGNLKEVEISITHAFSEQFMLDNTEFHLDDLDFFMGHSCNKEFDIYDMMTLANYFGMDLNFLCKLYIAKNTLNVFRQDNGYKQGTYNKIWNGEEDNVIMMKFVNGNGLSEDNYESDLYDLLKVTYNDIFN